jgi:hypothetical protein
MGYQHRKSIKSRIQGFKKLLRETGKDRKRIRRRASRQIGEEKQPVTEREISDLTLKRLHTLGIQKFGSSPFSEHFDRWLMNVEAILVEFESHPTIGIDDQYVRERSQALSTIKLQLDNRTQREATLNNEISKQSQVRNQLKQINKEYGAKIGALKSRKNREIKRLQTSIDRLKKEQEEVIRLKTGFFRGISKKKREQKELEVTQQLSAKQNELELFVLDFAAVQQEVRDEHDNKRAPVLKQIRYFQKIGEELETDDSLEERWFACESFIDAVNTFLQRKAIQPH